MDYAEFKELSRLLGHDMRVPMNAVIGFARLLDHESLGGQAPAQKVAVARLLALSQQLLDQLNRLSDWEAFSKELVSLEQYCTHIHDPMLDGAHIAMALHKQTAQLSHWFQTEFVDSAGDGMVWQYLLRSAYHLADMWTHIGTVHQLICAWPTNNFIRQESGLTMAGAAERAVEQALQETALVVVMPDGMPDGVAPAGFQRAFLNLLTFTIWDFQHSNLLTPLALEQCGLPANTLLEIEDETSVTVKLEETEQAWLWTFEMNVTLANVATCEIPLEPDNFKPWSRLFVTANLLQRIAPNATWSTASHGSIFKLEIPK